MTDVTITCLSPMAGLMGPNIKWLFFITQFYWYTERMKNNAYKDFHFAFETLINTIATAATMILAYDNKD